MEKEDYILGIAQAEELIEKLESSLSAELPQEAKDLIINRIEELKGRVEIDKQILETL